MRRARGVQVLADALRSVRVLCVADLADDGEGWATIRALAADLEVSEAWASRVLRRLRDRGWVAEQWWVGPDGSRVLQVRPSEKGVAVLAVEDWDRLRSRAS